MFDERPPLRAASVRSVATLVREVAEFVAGRFGACSVRGELSGVTRAASGHLYFNLKDADGGTALLRCAMFRRAAGMLAFLPGEGQLVELRGRVGVYEPRGELQFVVEGMQRAGEGALYEQFLRIKARLEAEGLFDTAAKRALPRYPCSLGVVTSLAGAALHDVLNTLARRAPQVRVVVYPSLVQGADAPAALAAALALASARDEVELLLLCRGGGSLEDLWAFNDERVVRAIRAASVPVVCGVGHETDVTLADFAADLRAPTPTAAAELAAPRRSACIEALASIETQLHRTVRNVVDGEGQRLDRSALRLARPDQGLRRHGQRLSLLAHRLATHWPQAAQAQRALLGQVQGELRFRSRARIASECQQLSQVEGELRFRSRARLASEQQRMSALGARLEALDPSRVLARGYAWLTDAEGRAVMSIKRTSAGMALRAVLMDGSADVIVTEVRPVPTID